MTGQTNIGYFKLWLKPKSLVII